jgi:hypothetical protein
VRVELAADLFADTDNCELIDCVADLFRCFAKRQHDLVLAPTTVGAVGRFFAGNLPKHKGTYTAVAKVAATRALAYTGTSQRGRVRLVCRADVVDSAVDLCQPATLVLENGDGDRCFVVAIAQVFGRPDIVRAIEENWLEIVHAGGAGEIPKVAKNKAGGFRRWKRVVALFDGDRWLPGTRSKHQNQADELDQHGITVHILLLREAENYVPHKAIAGSPGRRYRAVSLRLRHLRQLTLDQQGCFDMKHGFKHGLPREADPLDIRHEQRELYPNLPAQVRRGLHDGFGEDLLERLHQHREALCEQDFDHLGEAAIADLREMLEAVASQI